MLHATPLISTIVAGLAVAFLFGLLAHRLRLPVLAGYLLAGVVIGPFTPGYVANVDLAGELAEIGVILLMFGVGLHFSLRELLAVRTIAVPGALAQMGSATILGWLIGLLLGWPSSQGLLFGLSLSVASTVVLLRALQQRDAVSTPEGQIAIGWLIVEDLAMVGALVLIPPLSGLSHGQGDGALGDLALTLLVTFAKVAAFIGLMLIVGRRAIPWLLHYVDRTGSRELFRLAVLATALGVAYASARLFGVSFALGAFFAGMVMAGSNLSSRAMTETLPLRDAFAVLFFVSVGMLFNPSILIEAPGALILTCIVVVLGKSLAAFLIARLFGHSSDRSLVIAASLAQIGEFSFILAVMGVKLELLDEVARDLIVAGAFVSILVNPALFHAIDRYRRSTSA